MLNTEVQGSSNQIKSFNAYKAMHLQYTQCDKNTYVSCFHSEIQSIKANINNVQLRKINFTVTGQQISRKTSFKTIQRIKVNFIWG